MTRTYIRKHTTTKKTDGFLKHRYVCAIPGGDFFIKTHTQSSVCVLIPTNGTYKKIGICSTLATFVEVVFNYLETDHSIADVVMPKGIYYNRNNETIDLVRGLPLLTINHLPTPQKHKLAEWLVTLINNNLK
jgi:hypothetical protein